MSTFNTSILVTADTDQAEGALRRTGTELRALGPAAASGGRQASGAIRQMTSDARGSTANLVSQFNDIGVTLASGQSPLLIAAQQGTQISQVLGPLGAAGAVRALGAAFLSALNPVNIAIFAVVGGLGLLVNGIRGAFGEVRDLDDAISDLAASNKAFNTDVKAALKPVADLREEYGRFAEQIRAVNAAQLVLDINKLGAAQSGLVAGLQDQLDDVTGIIDQIRRAEALLAGTGTSEQKLVIRENLEGLIDELGLSVTQASNLKSALDAVAAARGPEDLAAAAAKLRQAILATADASGRLPEGFSASLEATNALEVSAVNVARAVELGAGAGEALAGGLGDGLAAGSGLVAQTDLWAGAMAQVAQEVRGIGAALAGIGGGLLANAAKQVEIEALRAGKSASEARLEVARREIDLETQARVDGADTVFGRLAAVAEGRVRLNGLALDEELAAERAAAAERERLANRAARSGRPARDSAADRAARAAQTELAILRESDPLQREILRLRDQMIGKTEEQIVLQAELNIKTREQTDAINDARSAWETFSRAGASALDDLIIRGNSARDVISNLLQTLASAVLQSALLGGGLNTAFGGAAGGLFGALGRRIGIPGRADGGIVHGAGGPRDDRILARLSAGEFVVNAAATARNRLALEQINAAPRFAGGGIVGGGALPGGRADQAPIVIDLRLSDDLDARISQAAEGVAVRVTRDGIAAFSARGLPRRIAEVSRDPRRVG